VRRGLRICFAAGEYFGVVWLLPVLTQREFQDAGAAMYAPSFWPLFQPRFPSYAGFQTPFCFFYSTLFGRSSNTLVPASVCSFRQIYINMIAQ